MAHTIQFRQTFSIFYTSYMSRIYLISSLFAKNSRRRNIVHPEIKIFSVWNNDCPAFPRIPWAEVIIDL